MIEVIFAPLLHTGLGHAVGQALHGRGLPGGVDELMHQLDVADAHLVRQRADQVLRLREAVHEGVGVDGERKSHVARPALAAVQYRI